MGGFHRGGSTTFNDNEAEVENLLSQLEDESLLKLRADTHRSTDEFRTPGAAEVVSSGGLDDNLLIRFANLKSRPPKQSQGVSSAKNEQPGAHDEDDQDENEDEDALVAELEERLKALKAKMHSSSGESGSSPTGAAPSLKSSSSGGSSKSRSFSPLKMIKQLSMGRKNNRPKSISAEDELISSVANAIAKEKKKQKKGGTKSSKHEDELDEDEDFDESLLNDLDLKLLKKELNEASGEQDRIAREAQQVIEWAKDAARLKAAGDGDESDLEEELLHLGEHGDEDEDEVKLDSPKNLAKKKKKGKKWSLF